MVAAVNLRSPATRVRILPPSASRDWAVLKKAKLIANEKNGVKIMEKQILNFSALGFFPPKIKIERFKLGVIYLLL